MVRTRVPATEYVALIFPALLCLGLCCYQLSLPHLLFGADGYDGGVYLGASIRLLQGLLPYRDFAIVYPPGSVLLFTPVAALGRIFGTRDAMAIARCTCMVIASLNVLLVSLLARPFGRVAMFAAGLALACWPYAYSAEQMELEPFVACFCLLGALCAFDGGVPASARRLLFAGVAFGFAGTIREWAIVPVIAVLACLIGRWKDRVRPFLLGTLLGFAVPTLPFFLLAPHAFLHDVLVTPLSEVPYAGFGAVSIALRLGITTGVAALPGLSGATGVQIGVAIGAVALVLALYFSHLRKISPLEWFILIAAMLSVATILFPKKFWPYFAYFPVVFLALLLGACAGRVTSLAEEISRRRPRFVLRTLSPRMLVAIVALVFAGAFTDKSVAYADLALRPGVDPGKQIAAAIPRGACALSDVAILLISSNRLDDTGARCPALVDSVGFWWTQDPADPPPYPGPSFPPSLVGAWRTWLEHSDYFVEAFPPTGYIPWTSSLRAWFEANYRVVSKDRFAIVYERVAHESSRPRARLADPAHARSK